MEEQRKRNQTLTIRLTETEKESITAQARRARMNLTEYILALNRGTEIVVPPDLTPLLRELKRIGNNVNQIAARVNSGATYAPGLEDVAEMQRAVYDALLLLMEGEPWRR